MVYLESHAVLGITEIVVLSALIIKTNANAY